MLLMLCEPRVTLLANVRVPHTHRLINERTKPSLFCVSDCAKKLLLIKSCWWGRSHQRPTSFLWSRARPVQTQGAFPAPAFFFVTVISTRTNVISLSLADASIKESNIARAPAYTFGSRYANVGAIEKRVLGPK